MSDRESAPLNVQSDDNNDEPGLPSPHLPILPPSSKEGLRARLDEVFQGTMQIKSLIVTVIICAVLSSNRQQYGLNAQNIMGWAFLSVYCLYYLHIWYLFLKAKYLYRIYTIGYVPDDWAPMSIAKSNHVVEPHQFIISISQFSAIAGGVAKMLLARVGTMQWGLLIALITIEQMPLRWSLICQCIGAFGMVMIGMNMFLALMCNFYTMTR